MDIGHNKYHLPDFKIFESQKERDFFIWIPDKTYIILGRSNEVEKSVYIENVIQDRMEVLKRPSGGEAVIISPRTIVLAVKLPLEKNTRAHDSFYFINQQIIQSLKDLSIGDVQRKGISDIAIGKKKILGSAIYKKPDKIFYHAVLNYGEDVLLFDHYLKHPSREPDYRLGRKHSEFVTSINAMGYDFSIEELVSAIQLNFQKSFG